MAEKVSVVLPVYQSEKYLDRCIQSVVDQTYQNLEIILVDDGSLDRCPDICDAWAKKDDRIRVIHKENAGAGMARNSGIEAATGKYICFFDSDDYVETDTIQKGYEAVTACQADVALWGVHFVDRRGNVTDTHIPCSEREVFRGKEVQEIVLPALLEHSPCSNVVSDLWMSVWAGMFSLEMIRQENWRFVSEREVLSEDFYSLLALYRHVRCVALVKSAQYFHCENEASLSHTFPADREEKNNAFYRQCTALADELGYNQAVHEALVYPYLGNVIGALKWILTAVESVGKN